MNQYPPMNQHPRTARPLAVTLLIGIPAVALGLYLWFGVAQARCTVGVSGFAANVTFTGPGASDACSNIIRSNTSQYYPFQGDPTGTELCVGDYQTGTIFPLRFTVRDTGLLNIVGTLLCKSLMNSQTGAQQ